MNKFFAVAICLVLAVNLGSCLGASFTSLGLTFTPTVTATTLSLEITGQHAGYIGLGNITISLLIAYFSDNI